MVQGSGFGVRVLRCKFWRDTGQPLNGFRVKGVGLHYVNVQSWSLRRTTEGQRPKR